MMGKKVRVFSALPHDVSLEEFVPEVHFYRRLEGALDLSFVRELVAPLYAAGGRPSGTRWSASSSSSSCPSRTSVPNAG